MKKVKNDRNRKKIVTFLAIPGYKLVYLLFLDITNYFPLLQVNIYLKRSLMYYIFQMYAPTMLLMILNFSSYWIPDEAVPARITMIVTTFLTITFNLQAATDSTVKISYINPMQWFLGVNILFIVASVVQYMILLTLKNKKRVSSFSISTKHRQNLVF